MKFEAPLAKRTISGVFWMLFGKGSQGLLQFVVLFTLARLLSPSDFGIASAAGVIISFTTIFSMIGVGPVLVQRPELNESHIRTGFTVTIFLSLLCMVLLYFGSPFVAGFFKIKELTAVLKVVSIIFLLSGLSTVAESMLQRDLKFKFYIATEAISYLFYGITGVILAWMDFGYWSLITALIVQNLIKSMLLIYFSKHNMMPQFKWKTFRELLFFGSGFTIGKIGSQFAKEADNLVVGRWLGAEALGLYGRAYQLLVMPSILFGSATDKVLFPIMARLQDNENSLTDSYRIGITTISVITVPISVLIVFLSKDIVFILFGSNWLNLIPAFQVLSIGLLFRTSYKISDSISRAVGAVYQIALRKITYAVVVFLGALIGQNWGIVGVSIGVLVGLILYFISMAQLSLKFTSLSWGGFLKAHLPSIFLGIVAGINVLIIYLLTYLIVIPSILKVMLTTFLFIGIVTSLLKSNNEKLLGRDILFVKNEIVQLITKRLSKSKVEEL